MRDCAPVRRCADDLKRPTNLFRKCLQVLRRSSRREQSELLSGTGDYQPRRPQRFGQDHADELTDWPDQTLTRRNLRPRPYPATTYRVLPASRILHAVRFLPSWHEWLRLHLLAASSSWFRPPPGSEAHERSPGTRRHGASGTAQSGGLQQRDAT